MEALAERIGRDAVNALIDNRAQRPLTLTDYPREDSFLLDLRETLNRMLG